MIIFEEMSVTVDYSLSTALQNLFIDPFPTKIYRRIVRFLQILTKLMEKINHVQLCYIEDLFEDLKTAPENKFIPSISVYEVLSECKFPQKFNCLVIKLLYFVVYKVAKSSSEDAAIILHDFNSLKNCILTFRNNSIWDNQDLDDIIIMFLEKLVNMVKEMNQTNVENKLHLFNVIRLMITDLGKQACYGVPTLSLLNTEITIFYEHVKTLQPGCSIDAYVIENHLTFLFILNDLIGGNNSRKNEQEVQNILTSIGGTLSKIMALKKASFRESYLTQNILRMIEVFQL